MKDSKNKKPEATKAVDAVETPDVNAVLAMLKAGAKRGAKAKTRKYEVLMPDAEALADLALAPQAIVMIEVLLSWMAEHKTKAPDTPAIIREAELAIILDDEAVAEKLASKQNAWKVWSYYRTVIKEAGFIREM